MNARLRVRPLFWGLLALVAAWGGVATWRRVTRPTELLATTTCPLFGEPRIVIGANVAADDSAFVRIHEEMHASQCRQFGAMHYWALNLTARGKLDLEAPAYCVAAAFRLHSGQDSSRVSERLHDDITDALRNVADSAAIAAALRVSCPEIAAAGRARKRER